MSLTAFLQRAVLSRPAVALALAAALAILPTAAPAWAGQAALEREAAVAREQRDCQAQVLVARGRQLLASKAYAEARDAFRQALRLRPDDPACRTLLADAEAALGVGGGKGILDRVKERRTFTARAVVRQFDTDLFEAERMLRSDPRQAAQRAERVLQGIGYIEDPARSAELRKRAKVVLAEAEANVQRTLAGRRETALAEVRALGTQRAQTHATSLRSLRETGWKHLEAGDHEKALGVADEILRRDPANKDALKLKDEVRLAGLSSATLRGRSALRRQRTSELMKELEAELTPPKRAQIVLPGSTGGGTRGIQGQPMAPWERDLRARLAQPISIEFRETPLEDAVKQIGTIAGVSIVVDPGASTRRVPVTITQARMPASSLLRWAARFGGLDYSLRDGAVLLARHGGPLDEPVRRTYDVASLVTPPNEGQPLAFLGPVEPLPHPTANPTPAEPDPGAVGGGWVKYIRNTIAPESWGRVLQEAPVYTISYRNGRIVVLHTPEVHKEIEDLLNNFRKSRSLQVHIIARFIEVSKAYLDSFDLSLTNFNSQVATGVRHDSEITGSVDNQPERGGLTRFPSFLSGGGGLSLTWNYLGNDQASALLEAVVKKRRGTILTAPRLTCFNTQRANLQVLVNYNYVRRVTGDDEPEIGNVPEGIVFDVQPFVSADRRYITLVLQPQMRELVSLASFHYATEPIEVQQGNVIIVYPQYNFVQLPITRLRSMGTTVTVPNGGTLLMGGFTEVEERAAVASVPFLGGIPLLGRLLRGWGRAEGRRSLLMLVTAQTVEDVFEE